MMGWIAFLLFYILVPLAVLVWVLAHRRRPRGKQKKEEETGPAAAAQREVVRLLTPLPQAIRTVDDKRGAFLRLATCINDARRYCTADPYTCYYLNVLRLINVTLSDDERSFLQAPLVTGHVADLLDQSLEALRNQNRVGLYVVLSNLSALALRREQYVAWQPHEQLERSSQDQTLLEELTALAELFVRMEAQGKFQRDLAHWHRRARWQAASTDLLLPFSYLAQRMSQPRLTVALSPAQEALALQRERYSVAALAWAVVQALHHRDYAVILDLLVEDLASRIAGNGASAASSTTRLAPEMSARSGQNN